MSRTLIFLQVLSIVVPMRAAFVSSIFLLAVLTGNGTPTARAAGSPDYYDTIIQANITGIAISVAVLTDNDFVLVGGTSTIEASLAELTLRPQDGLVIRYDASGTYEWHRVIDLDVGVSFTDVVADTAYVYAVGYAGAGKGFIAQIGLDGPLGWMANYTITGAERVDFFSVEMHESELVVTGAVRDVPVFFPFISRIDPYDGSLIASYSFTTSLSSGWYGISAAGSQTFFVAGADGCVGKVGFTSIDWESCDDTYGDALYGVANHNGNVLAAGYVEEGSERSAVLINRTSSGSLNWAATYNPSNEGPYVASHVTTLGSNIFHVGSNATVNYGFMEEYSYKVGLKAGGTMTTMFASKHSAAGSRIWSVESGGLYNDVAFAAAVDSSTNPKLLLVGAEIATTGLVAHPKVVRYEDL